MRHSLVRRLAAHLGAAGLVTGLLTVATPAAAAATAPADLGVTTQAYSADLAVGGGRVFVGADDRVIVADATGTPTGDVITGLSGVRQLAMAQDGARLYAALSGSNEVAEIDTATLAVTRRLDLSSHPCPVSLALLGERLWVGHGCDTGKGGVVGLDLSATAPVPVAVGGEQMRAPVLAAAGDTLVVGQRSVHEGDLLVYDVVGDAPELRGTIEGDQVYLDYLRDLALSSDGTALFAMASSPNDVIRFDTRTLTVTGEYGDGWIGYASAVALSGDGAYVALAAEYGNNDLTVYDAASGTALFGAEQWDAEALLDGVAFSGSDVFMLLRSTTDRLLLWRVTGAELPASTLTVTAPTYAYVGSPATIEGRLTRADGKPLALKPLTVIRRSTYEGKELITGVRTGKDGTFSFEDTMQERGEWIYLVYWEGDDRYRRAGAFAVLNARDRSTLTLDGPETGTAGTTVQLTGTLTANGRSLGSWTTFTVLRSIKVDGVSDSVTLPPVRLNADGTFTLTDTLTTAGHYTYLATWKGDITAGPAKATHRITVE